MGNDASVIVPVNIVSAEFTAGPNPVLRSSGVVRFYRQGARVADGQSLRVYDATGNVVGRVSVKDNKDIMDTNDRNDRRVIGDRKSVV